MPVVPPPLIALAAGVVQHALAPDRRPGVARRLAAAAVAAGSVGLMGAAVSDFRRAGTTVEPFTPSHATTLVTTGANAITRNPMYVGMSGLLTAHAILRGGVATLLPVAGFVATIDRLQIRPEESALAEVFGADYADYRARVPRWLGPAAR